jgi:hypothetical protein
LRDLASTDEAADSVRHVDHVIARLEVGEIRGEGRELRLSGSRLRYQIGSVE